MSRKLTAEVSISVQLRNPDGQYTNNYFHVGHNFTVKDKTFAEIGDVLDAIENACIDLEAGKLPTPSGLASSPADPAEARSNSGQTTAGESAEIGGELDAEQQHHQEGLIASGLM